MYSNDFKLSLDYKIFNKYLKNDINSEILIEYKKQIVCVYMNPLKISSIFFAKSIKNYSYDSSILKNFNCHFCASRAVLFKSVDQGG